MDRSVPRLLATALFCLAVIPATAYPADADSLFNDQKWEEAAAAYREIVRGDPSNGQAWLRLGVSLRRAQRPGEALEALLAAEKAGVSGANLHASMALAHAALGNLDATLSSLRSAAEEGLPVDFLESNPDLAEAREDPRFQGVIDAARRRANPCLHDQRYGAFDFWVGEWDVYSGDRLVGTNVIQKILQGCLVFENWTNGRGVSGKSFNYYDPGSGTWRQNWVSETGAIVRYEGNVRDGAMHYEGERIDAGGRVELARVTLSPLESGNVRHLIEHSSDGGKTWFDWFDAVYVPMGSPPPASSGEDAE